MSKEWKEVTPPKDESEIWSPEEGDEIEGVFKEVKEDIGPNNSKLYTITTEKGDIKLWGSTVLDDRLAGIDFGTDIKVLYKGMVKGKNSSYKDWGVYMDKDAVTTAPDAQNGAPEDVVPLVVDGEEVPF